MATIFFEFEDDGIPSKEVTVPSDITVLEATEMHEVHLNHNCGGVCACSTCHIYVLEGEDSLEEISDKEENYIDRAINPRINSRLACQCLILDDKARIKVLVPDQKQIIGHEH